MLAQKLYEVWEDKNEQTFPCMYCHLLLLPEYRRELDIEENNTAHDP